MGGRKADISFSGTCIFRRGGADSILQNCSSCELAQGRSWFFMGVTFITEPLVAFLRRQSIIKTNTTDSPVHLCRLTFITQAWGTRTYEPVSCFPTQYHICRRISNENIWRRRSKHGIIVYIMRVPSAKKTFPRFLSVHICWGSTCAGFPPQCFPSSSSSCSSSNSDTDFPQCNVWTDLLC